MFLLADGRPCATLFVLASIVGALSKGVHTLQLWNYTARNSHREPQYLRLVCDPPTTAQYMLSFECTLDKVLTRGKGVMQAGQVLPVVIYDHQVEDWVESKVQLITDIAKGGQGQVPAFQLDCFIGG